MDFETWKACTGSRTTSVGVALCAMAAAALTAPAARAQQCGATITPTIDPPNVVFAVGQSLRLNITFGPTSVPQDGFRNISQLTVRLDCQNPEGCNFATPCMDGGPFIGYNGDASLIPFCPGTTITSNHGVGPNPNDVVFTFEPPLALQANESCAFSFGVTVLSLGSPPDPKVINGIAFFVGTCNTGLSASACGTYEIEVVQPDIEIVKSACPRIVCFGG